MRAVFFRPAQVRVRPDNSPVTGRQGVFGASLALRSEIHSPSSLQPRELLGVFASSASDALEETSTVHETVTGTWGPEFRTADDVLRRRDVNGDQDVWDLLSLPAGVSLIQNANTSELKVRLSPRVTFSREAASKSVSFANGYPAAALASAREFYVANYAGTPVPKCHPELMYIEQKWGLVKPKIRKRVNGSSVGFMAMVFEEMRAAPLLSIQRFARKCRDTLAIYKEGREYEEVPGLLKEKKSHRTGLL